MFSWQYHHCKDEQYVNIDGALHLSPQETTLHDDDGCQRILMLDRFTWLLDNEILENIHTFDTKDIHLSLIHSPKIEYMTFRNYPRPDMYSFISYFNTYLAWRHANGYFGVILTDCSLGFPASSSWLSLVNYRMRFTALSPYRSLMFPSMPQRFLSLVP